MDGSFDSLLEVPCERCGGTGRVMEEGSRHFSKKCHECLNGLVLTPLGKRVVECVRRRLRVDVKLGGPK